MNNNFCSITVGRNIYQDLKKHMAIIKSLGKNFEGEIFNPTNGTISIIYVGR